jgi:hypothetical protein
MFVRIHDHSRPHAACEALFNWIRMFQHFLFRIVLKVEKIAYHDINILIKCILAPHKVHID